MAVDAAGNTYILGGTDSGDLPMAAPTYQMTVAYPGGDAYVAKFNSAGVHLYTTYIGDGGATAQAIAIDGSQSVYVVVDASNSTFLPPIGCGSQGSSISYRVKLINEATALEYACRAPAGFVTDVAVTSGGAAYWTTGTTSGSCIQKGPPATLTILHCFDYRTLTAIALQPNGSIWVAGYTFGPTYDVFVAKIGGLVLNPPYAPTWCETCLAYSTTWGGSGTDMARAIAVNSEGTAFATGHTTSLNLPGATNTFKGGYSDAFMARFIPGSAPSAQYIGGSGSDSGNNIAVRMVTLPFSQTLVYIAGSTHSANFPSTLGFGPACSTSGSAFVWRNNQLGYPGWSGCVGAANTHDGRLGLSHVGLTRVHVAGSTPSSALNPAANVGQMTNAGANDAWITVFRE